MANDDRRSNDLELIKGAVDRDRKRDAAKKDRPQGGGGSGTPMMYRGQPVAGRGKGRAPGAPVGAGGASRSNAGSPAGSSDGDAVKDSLQKVTQLFNDGLITKPEFDAKRAEILDRL